MTHVEVLPAHDTLSSRSLAAGAVLKDEENFDHPNHARASESIAEHSMNHGRNHEMLDMSSERVPSHNECHSRGEVSTPSRGHDNTQCARSPP